MLFLKLLFRDEGHLYANCLFYIPTIYPKCHRFHYFSRGIRMPFPILTGIQSGRYKSPKKQSYVKENVLFAALFP